MKTVILRLRKKEYIDRRFHAFKGDLVEFTEEEAERRLKEEKGTWEKVKKDEV